MAGWNLAGTAHRAKTDPKAVRNLPPLVDDATKDSLKTRTYSLRPSVWHRPPGLVYLLFITYYLSLIYSCAAIPRPAASKSNDILQKYLKEFSERSESLMLSFNRCVEVSPTFFKFFFIL